MKKYNLNVGKLIPEMAKSAFKKYAVPLFASLATIGCGDLNEAYNGEFMKVELNSKGTKGKVVLYENSGITGRQEKFFFRLSSAPSEISAIDSNQVRLTKYCDDKGLAAIETCYDNRKNIVDKERLLSKQEEFKGKLSDIINNTVEQLRE